MSRLFSLGPEAPVRWIARSTFYKNKKEDLCHEFVRTGCRLDVCERCHWFDNVLEPMVAKTVGGWLGRLEELGEGISVKEDRSMSNGQISERGQAYEKPW